MKSTIDLRGDKL